MQVKLISVTKPLIKNAKDEFMSMEELLVYIARVSNPSNQMNTETSDRLVNYLIKNQHWSPFDLVDLCFEVKTSRAIAAQILRHKSMYFQEFSQRYAEVTDMEPIQLRKAGSLNRQSSTEVFDPEIKFHSGRESKASVAINLHIKQSQGLYNHLLEQGVAKECARMVLPLTTQTTLYVKGTLRSFLTYLNIRLDGHTQLEHREIAEAIALEILDEFPMISKALNRFNDLKGMFI